MHQLCSVGKLVTIPEEGEDDNLSDADSEELQTVGEGDKESPGVTTGQGSQIKKPSRVGSPPNSKLSFKDEEVVSEKAANKMSKGLCGGCGKEVWNTDHREKDPIGVYYHLACWHKKEEIKNKTAGKESLVPLQVLRLTEPVHYNVYFWHVCIFRAYTFTATTTATGRGTPFQLIAGHSCRHHHSGHTEQQ